jgi:tetratricopeptide (TPR) repeat protein
MTSARRVNVVATVVLLASAACGVATLNAVDRLRRQREGEQTLYIRSGTVLRRLSLGYTGLLADIYWTRAVQYFGYQHHRNSGDFRLLAPLLQVTTELDPHLIPPYQFGANFLAQQPPTGAGLPGEALALMKYGVEHNPDNWRLYYNLGFLYFTEFKDYAKAGEAFAAGAKLPVTNEFMPVLAARMAQHAGEFETARMLWYTTYQSTNDGAIRDNAVKHLIALRADEDVTRLEEVVQKYRQQTKRLPESMSDLERAGFIDGTPADPNGKPYRLMPDGRIEVHDPGSIFYITKGLPPGMSTPTPKPESAPIPKQ